MLQRSEFRAMGSKIVALVDCEIEPPALATVPAWFEEWEQILSRFRSDSELSQLNCRAGYPQPVSEVLWDVFACSLEAADITAGLTTPLILDALLNAGYTESFDLLKPGIDLPLGQPGSTEFLAVTLPPRSGKLEDIVSDPSARTICLPRTSRLDFGGIAKGWAADQAAKRLCQFGPALVSAGGDITVTGPRLDGEPWQIAIEDPFNDGLFVENVYLRGGGVATSGKDRRHWIHHGAEQHHIIDPRTGLPAATDVLTATVVATSVMQAEAFAKAVLISGSQAGLDLLDHSNDLAGLLILDNGERLYSQRLEQFL